MTIRTRTHLLSLCFFLFPFCLFAGRAAQANGFYLFLCLLPMIFFPRSLRAETRIALLCFGSGLCFLYMLFPLADAWQLIATPDTNASFPDLRWRKILSSQFSSSIFITGLIALVLTSMPNRGISREHSLDQTRVLRPFVYGCLAACLILAFYCLVQFLSGFNFAEAAAYRQDRIMAGRFYRISGFANHPVPFAGFLLVIFGFHWALFWDAAQRYRAHDGVSAASLGTALLVSVMIFATGSRMALVCWVIVGAATVWTRSRLTRIQKLWYGLLATGAMLPLAWLTGILSRFQEALGTGRHAGLGERLSYWQVYWRLFLEKPWFGQGHHLLEAYTRPEAYQQLSQELATKNFNAHNVYLETITNLGVIGAVGFGLGLFWALRGYRGLANSTALVSATGTAFLALCLFGLTQNSFFDTPSTIAMLSLCLVTFWSAQGEQPR